MARTTPTTTKPANQHPIARAVLMEAAERIIGKEHSRDDLMPGSFPFEFTISGKAGERAFSEPYAGTLGVGEDGIKTPSISWQAVAASLLASMNEATQAARLADIAAGRFLEADEGLKGRIDAAAKQWREATKSATPERKRGDVKPVYAAVEAATVEMPPTKPAKVRKAG